MNLLNFKHREDAGHQVYVQFINVRTWSLFQASVSWNDWPSLPFIQIKSGTGSALSILFWAYKLGFDIDFLARTWNFNYVEDQVTKREQ